MRAAASQLGTLDPHVLRARIDEGPPFWPAGRAFQYIRAPGRVVLSTAGLGHPWDDPGRPGYGYEFVLEVDENHGSDPWVFPLIARVAQWSISSGSSLEDMFAEAATPTFETSGAGLPDAWRSHTGRVGMLLGLSIPECPSEFETDDGMVRFIAITLLHPRELAAVIENPEARTSIADELMLRPRGHATSLDRELTAMAAAHCAPYSPPAVPSPEPAPGAKNP